MEAKSNGLVVLLSGKCFRTVLLILVWVAMTVSGHGRLIEPPSRSTMWRFNFDNPTNYNDMELFCGGFTRQYSKNGGKCGICGDPWDATQPRDNEAGGLYGNGIVVATYNKGQMIRASVELTAAHKGHFEFRTCPAPSIPTVEVTQECLDQLPLELADGSGTKYYLPPGSGNGVFTIDLLLPPALTCQRCVFQWIYKCGNNWGICPDGSGKIGCGAQEEFRGCADITVRDVEGASQHNAPAAGGATSVTPTLAPPPFHQQHVTPPPPRARASRQCQAVYIWALVAGMHQWCITNCNHVPAYCPDSHCKCT